MKPKEDASWWRTVLLSCVLATLPILAPWIWLFCIMQRGASEVRHAQDEFERSVNPDELRAWVFTQLKEHPEGGDFEVPEEDRPKTFPHLSERHFRLHLYPSKPQRGEQMDTLSASMIWNFSGGHGLKVTVLLNPDGSPPDVESDSDRGNGIQCQILAR